MMNTKKIEKEQDEGEKKIYEENKNQSKILPHYHIVPYVPPIYY